jgi:hypothetical protein
VVEIDLVLADGVTGPEEGQDSLYPGINLGQPCFEGIKALENRRLLHARFRRVFLFLNLIGLFNDGLHEPGGNCSRDDTGQRDTGQHEKETGQPTAAPSAMNVKAAPTRIHGRLPPACSDVNTAASVFFSFGLVATQLPRMTDYTPSVPKTTQPRKGAL